MCPCQSVGTTICFRRAIIDCGAPFGIDIFVHIRLPGIEHQTRVHFVRVVLERKCLSAVVGGLNRIWIVVQRARTAVIIAGVERQAGNRITVEVPETETGDILVVHKIVAPLGRFSRDDDIILQCEWVSFVLTPLAELDIEVHIPWRIDHRHTRPRCIILPRTVLLGIAGHSEFV